MNHDFEAWKTVDRRAKLETEIQPKFCCRGPQKGKWAENEAVEKVDEDGNHKPTKRLSEMSGAVSSELPEFMLRTSVSPPASLLDY